MLDIKLEVEGEAVEGLEEKIEFLASQEILVGILTDAVHPGTRGRKSKKGRDNTSRRKGRKTPKRRRSSGGRTGTKSSRSRSSNLKIWEIAAIHEYGAPKANIKPRSFMRPTYMRMQTKMQEKLGAAVDIITAGGGEKEITQYLHRLGLLMVSEVKKTIRQLKTPALAPSTIARKGSTKLLIDTSIMINAIKHTVISIEGV